VARYAEGTTVDVSKTKGEMMELLSRAGASHYGFGTEPERELIVFRLFDRHYRFTVERPTLDEVKDTLRRQGRDLSRVQSWPDKVDAEWRRRWRARLIFLKALLEYAEGDDTEARRLLLPFTLLPDGKTVGEWSEPQIESAYSTGRMPPLLTGGNK
jgi:hypothetical protein